MLFSVYYKIPANLQKSVKLGQLCIAEAVAIKKLKPAVCVQKKIRGNIMIYRRLKHVHRNLLSSCNSALVVDYYLTNLFCMIPDKYEKANQFYNLVTR